MIESFAYAPSMEETIRRLFGSPVPPAATAATPSGNDGVKSAEVIYKNLQQLREYEDVYRRQIAQTREHVRTLLEQNLHKTAQKYVDWEMKLTARLNDLTDNLMMMNGVAEAIRSAETKHLSVEGMRAALATFKEFATKLDPDKVDALRGSLDEQLTELDQVQEILNQPLGNADVPDESRLDLELARYANEMAQTLRDSPITTTAAGPRKPSSAVRPATRSRESSKAPERATPVADTV